MKLITKWKNGLKEPSVFVKTDREPFKRSENSDMVVMEEEI